MSGEFGKMCINPREIRASANNFLQHNAAFPINRALLESLCLWVIANCVLLVTEHYMRRRGRR